MKRKFYELIVKGNDKIGGVLYAPEDWPYPIARDGEEVKNWDSLIVELRDGKFRPFHVCVGGANMVNEDFKNLIESFISPCCYLEFLPVKAISKKYGDHIYYIIHFKKIFDVIDRINTIFVDGSDSVIKLRLDYLKVRDLKVFNSQPFVNDIFVSDDIRESIKKNRLDLGLEFVQKFYVNE